MKHFDLSLLEDVSAHGLKNGVFQPTTQPRLHRHSEIELNYLEQGTITYQFNAEHVTMQAGQFALFWAVIPHQIIQAEEQSILHWVTVPFTYFLQRQLPDLLTQPIVHGKFVFGPADDDRRSILAMLQRWLSDLQSREGKQFEERQRIVLLEIEVYLRRFVLALTEEDKEQVTMEREPVVPNRHELNNVEQMALFIAEHYTESLRIDEVANVVHLHRNYAMDLFRKHFGLSMHDYITQYRLSHAQRLLITTDANASEIALAAGFGSVSRFYATFKEACGQSPGTYRTAYSGSWKESSNGTPYQDRPAGRRFRLSDQS